MRAGVFVLLVLVPAVQAGGGAALEEVLAAYLEARDPAARAELQAEVIARAPSVAALVEALPDAWRWDVDAPRGEVVTWTRESPDGNEHTVYAYAPRAYTPARSWPVLIWLHGAVGLAEDGGGEGGIGLFRGEAEARGFLLLSPSARDGTHWWSPGGAALVRGALRDLKRRWHADADRVCVAGFSDGASAAFHLLAHDPDPYACFVAFVGSPLVTRIWGGPTWNTNVASRPVYALSGGRDHLYPSMAMRPVMEGLREAGAALTWIDEAEARHDLSYLADRWEEVHAFWAAQRREALPASIEWTASRVPGEGRRSWIEILELDATRATADGVAAPCELPPSDVPPRPRLGLRVDPRHRGPGLLIEDVEDDTPAAAAGFRAGDVILCGGGVSFAGPGEPPPLASAFEGHSGECRFVVRRGRRELEIRARPLGPEEGPAPRPADLGYDVSPGTVAARVRPGNRIEIQADGVARLRLHLAAPLVDFEADLVVEVNGHETYRGRPPEDPAYCLAQAAIRGPGDPLWRGSLDLEVPGD